MTPGIKSVTASDLRPFKQKKSDCWRNACESCIVHHKLSSEYVTPFMRTSKAPQIKVGKVPWQSVRDSVSPKTPSRTLAGKRKTSQDWESTSSERLSELNKVLSRSNSPPPPLYEEIFTSKRAGTKEIDLTRLNLSKGSECRISTFAARLITGRVDTDGFSIVETHSSQIARSQSRWPTRGKLF
ncbi:hypothetical protein J6590_024140 [Homalodisca vitripennis]|nr:hypothetical protein J6590_024140 [Homalodisca vitripennis]